jgi:hypothetical protein
MILRVADVLLTREGEIGGEAAGGLLNKASSYFLVVADGSLALQLQSIVVAVFMMGFFVV